MNDVSPRASRIVDVTDAHDENAHEMDPFEQLAWMLNETRQADSIQNIPELSYDDWVGRFRLDDVDVDVRDDEELGAKVRRGEGR